MDQEIDSIERNKTWKPVESANDNKSIDVKWVITSLIKI